MSNFYLIGCIPLKARDTPPPEQRNCKGLPCGECSSLMWVSEAKRDIMAKRPGNAQLLCFDCIFLNYNQAVGNGTTDISEIDWAIFK